MNIPKGWKRLRVGTIKKQGDKWWQGSESTWRLTAEEGLAVRKCEPVYIRKISPVSGAKRSGVLQGCPTSANCSAEAGADARKDSLNSSVVPRKQAEPPGTELLPCPFCGGAAKLIYEQDSTPTEWWLVCCSDPTCNGSSRTRMMRRNKDHEIRAWNRRAGTEGVAPTALPPQGERALARNDGTERPPTQNL